MKQTRMTGSERKARFLDAAPEMVIDQGVFAVTMEGVAQKLGVAKSLGYRYFTGRDDLLAALYDRENQIYVDRLEDELPSDPSFDDWIRGACKLWFRRADERGELFTRLISDNGPLAARAKAGQRANVKGWADGIQKAYGLPRRRAEHFAWFLVAGAAGALAARNGEDDEAVIDTIAIGMQAAAKALRSEYGEPKSGAQSA